MNNKIDIEILKALRHGDHKAFEAVFIAYYDRVRIFIFGYIKSESDAEELVDTQLDIIVSLLDDSRKRKHSL